MSIWVFWVAGGWRKPGRPSGVVEPRRSDRGSGDERGCVLGVSSGAAGAANPLRAALL